MSETAFYALLDTILTTYPATDVEFAPWLESLNERDRHLLVTQGLHGQVCNGGFAQWIGNGYAQREVSHVLAALKRMTEQGPPELQAYAASATALVLTAQITAVLGGEHPHALDDDALDRLDKLDDAFYVFSDRFGPLMHAYFAGWR